VVGLVVIAVLALATVGLAGGTARAASTAASEAGHWVRLDSAAQDFPPGSGVTSVVTFRGKLVALGVVPDTGNGPIPVVGALWTATDGRRWRRVLPVPFGDSSGFQLVLLRSALYAVAAGEIGNQPSPSRVWRSTDGRTWRLLTASGPAGLSVVVAGPDGLVAVGSESASDCTVGPTCIRTTIWTSPDGVTWTRVARDAAARTQGFATGLVRTRDGLIAIGEKFEELPGTSPWVSTSRTGARWDGRSSPALTKAEAHVSGVAAGGRETLLLGSVPSHVTLPSTTTTTSPPVVSPDGKSTSVVVCGSLGGLPAVWTRTGNADWKRGSVSGMGSASVTKVVASHGAWVGAAVEGDCSSSHTVFVTSTDARRWHRQVAEPATGTPPTRYRNPSALAPTASGAIAFITPFVDPTERPEVWLWTAPK
jgi:hypothetical protein